MKHLIVFLPLLLIMGCAHTKNISPHSSQQVFNKMNKTLARKTVNVTMVSGEPVKAKILHIAPDSLRWTTEETGDTVVVATSEVKKIVWINHAEGATAGFFFGLIGGVATGALIGYLGTDDPGEDCFLYCFDRKDGAVMLGFVFGAISGVGGLLAGSKNGVHYTYRFQSTDDKSSLIQDRNLKNKASLTQSK